MRALLAALLLAGCFDPAVVDGLPCSLSRGCPEGQFCIGGLEYCSADLPPQSDFRQISAGAHTCAIDPQNELYCWGDNADGELGLGDRISRARPTRVGLDDDWVMVAAGDSFTIAIRDDGRLWGWGADAYIGNGGSVEPIVLDAATDWKSVTAGASVWAALDEDGAALIGGEGLSPAVFPGSWDTISVSGHHYCGLRGEELECWGQNSNGQVGSGSASDDIPAPVLIGTTQRWISVAAGKTHTCAVDDEGGLWCWGENTLGQAGQPDAGDETRVPTRVIEIGEVQSVVAGWDTTCARQDDANGGGAWCFGAGGDGQIGDSEADPASFRPRSVLFTVFYQISTGLDHTCGIDYQSRGYCWGSDDSGQLGDGETGRHFEPVSVPSEVSWTQVSVGPRHTCAIADDGHAECWGKNGHGQLGDRSELRRRYPSTVVDEVDDGGGWDQISAGYDHTCAIRTSGTLWCWGAAARGQLGIAGGFDLQTPAQVGETTTWSSVVAGDGGTCALDQATTLWCWGRAWGESPTIVEEDASWSGLTVGVDGEICGLRSGVPTCWNLDSTTAPVAVPGIDTEWDLHARGAATSCGIDDQGDMQCLGDDLQGALGDGDGVTPNDELVEPTIPRGWTAVAAGRGVTCGLRGSELYCWGWNAFGQVGDGTIGTRFEPVEIEPAQAWSTISVSERSVCAITEVGRNVWCWGVTHGAAGGWDAPAPITTP